MINFEISMIKVDLLTKRIGLICQFLNAGGGTLEEMREYVNENLVDLGLKEIGTRTLQTCLEKLRKGDFEHSEKGKPKKERARLFKIDVIENYIYKWNKNSSYPKFGDLDEDERFTLPFLAGILKQYESIPAVQKILLQLPHIFNISESEMESKNAIYHSGPQFFDDNDPRFHEKTMDCVIKILSCIHHSQCIEFHYTSTRNFEEKEKSYLVSLSPLQIRFYENYYYLIGLDNDNDSNKIRPYRVDQIQRHKIDISLDENDNARIFDREEIEKEHNFKSRLKYAMGIWINDHEDPLYEIKIKFIEFAATYIKRLKFHPSQKIIDENKKEKSITISLKLKLRKESDEYTKLEERQYDLAFLLGRFREYAQVISFKPI